MRQSNDKTLSNEVVFFQILRETELISPEIKAALIEEIQQKANTLKTSELKDTELLASSDRFFSPNPEPPSSSIGRKAPESDNNAKRNSSKKIINPLLLERLHGVYNEVRYQSQIIYSNSSSEENSPKSPKTKNSPESKNSPKNTLKTTSKSLINYTKKKKNDLINKDTLLQIPIDKKTATNYIKAINKELEGIDKFKIMPSPDGQYKIIIVPTGKKYFYYLLDNRPIGIGSSAKVTAAFNLETAELINAKIYLNTLAKRAKAECIALKRLGRFYGFGSLNDQECVVLYKHYKGSDLLTFLYEINHSVPNDNANFCLSKKKWPGLIKLKIVYKLLEQLLIFHNNNLLHRDIKPNNILVNIDTESGVEITLIDLDTCADKNAVDSEMMSTQGYIPPEILTLQGFGLVRLSFNPAFSSLEKVEKITGENNNALIYYDDEYFYFDQHKKEIINVTEGVENAITKYTMLQPILTYFPDKIDFYKESEFGLRKLIVKVTDRPLKTPYSEMSDIYSMGVCIAEINSEHNYQKNFREMRLKENIAISFELTQKMMPDVFLEEKYNQTQKTHDKTTECIIEQASDLLITDILNKLAVKLTTTRLKNSSLINEIERLKKIEFELNDKINSLIIDISKAQKTLENLISELYPASQSSFNEQQIYDQIVNKITGVFSQFSVLMPQGQEVSEASSFKLSS